METGNKNHCLTVAMHICFAKKALQQKLNLELFQNRSVHKFCRLKALVTLDQVNTKVVEKKREGS